MQFFCQIGEGKKKERKIDTQLKKAPGEAEAPVDLTIRFLETITGNKGNSSLLNDG